MPCTVEPDPGDPELLAIIREEIRSEGPMPFSRFQQLALYHPTRGYYIRGAGIGREGADFWTAPEMSPAFGDLIGAQIEEMFRHLDEPEDFGVLEVGAGTGALAAGLLQGWRHRNSPLYRKGVYRIKEISPELVKRQQASLHEHGETVDWWSEHGADGRPPGPGVILMNEVLDALPVDRACGGARGLEEICVDLAGSRLVEVLRRADSALRERVRCSLPPGASRLPPGRHVEVRPRLGGFLGELASLVTRGYLMVVDYGGYAEALHSSENEGGTLMAYWRHAASHDVLARVGLQDLTAHVNLSELAREARQLGFHEAGCTDQMRFLLALGLGDRIEALESEDIPEQERVVRRLAMTALIRPGGMGEIFKVWIGARQAPSSLRGFADPFEPKPGSRPSSA